MIDAVGVAVPVHDEEDALPSCLESVAVALAALPEGMPRLAVVILDACSDASDAIAMRWVHAAPGERRVIAVDERNVGRARAAGMNEILARFDAGTGLWLATTDADSRVPVRWLVDQLELAATGIEAIAGSIAVDDWTGQPSYLSSAFERFYAPDGSDDAHPHVHGANLGVRGDAYQAVGGFTALTTGEDHALWNALRASGRRCRSTRRHAVTTSARAVARAPAGFSGFLANLAASLQLVR